MKDNYENNNEHNPNKKRKTLIAFNDMLADVLSHKQRQLVVTELYFKSRKINISFLSPTLILLNSTCYFIMKSSDKREL